MYKFNTHSVLENGPRKKFRRYLHRYLLEFYNSSYCNSRETKVWSELTDDPRESVTLQAASYCTLRCMKDRQIFNCDSYNIRSFDNNSLYYSKLTYCGNEMFPRALLRRGDSISSAFVEFGYLTSNNAVSMPGFSSML